MLFKDISILGHLVQWSRIICAISEEGIMRNISVNYFEFRPVVQEITLMTILFSGVKPFMQFWLSIYEEPYCEIIINLD